MVKCQKSRLNFLLKVIWFSGFVGFSPPCAGNEKNPTKALAWLFDYSLFAEFLNYISELFFASTCLRKALLASEDKKRVSKHSSEDGKEK